MKKRVLFVIPYLCNGGAERALSNITTHFPEDYEIDILVNSSKQIDYEYRGNIISMEIDSEKKVDSVWFQFKVLLKRIRTLKRIKKEHKYLVCISFMDSANIANILSRSRQEKTIVSVRTSLKNTPTKAYKYIITPLVKLLYNRADTTVVVSQELALELEKFFGLKNVVTIENGFDVEKIKLLSQEPIEEEYRELIRGKKVIFTAGRLADPKRQWHLIRAMRQVVEVIPNALLLIAGSGELEGYLDSVIKNNNLVNNVKLMGNVDNVYRYERASDVFVFPSGWEGFPNALVEAMCVGVPCIVTDFKTGAREIIAPEIFGDSEPVTNVTKCSYGMIVPLCSGKKYLGSEPLEVAESFLAKAIVESIMSERLREEYGNKSTEKAEQLGIEKVVKRWTSLIEDI